MFHHQSIIMATQTPISLWKILSETWRVIAAHPRQFSALSALFLLPVSVAATLYHPSIISQLPLQSLFTISTPPDSNSGQLLVPIIYILSTLLFSLCAYPSIAYTAFATFHNKPVDFIPSLKSILVSFFPLLATVFTAQIILGLIILAFGALMLVSYYGLVMFGLDTRYFPVFVIASVVILVMVLAYFQVEWYLSSAVVVLESEWGFAPLKRSSYLVKGTRMVALRMFSFFGALGGVLSMWYVNRRRGGVSDGWIWVEMVVYVIFTTLLSLYAMAANTVLFVHCKASRGEMAVVVVIDEEIGGGEYVALPMPIA